MYAIELVPDFVKQVEALHPKRFKQIYLRVFALQTNPRPPDCVMIDPETYLVRVGPYAITYRIDDSLRRIRVFLLREQDEER